jgi:hypothetical protein
MYINTTKLNLVSVTELTCTNAKKSIIQQLSDRELVTAIKCPLK